MCIIDKEINRNFPAFLTKIRQVVLSKKEDEMFASWYDGEGNKEADISFASIWNQAGVIAHHIRYEWGMKKGEHVVLCYNFGLHFLVAFLGCLRAGVVAVIVYPPAPPLVKSLAKLSTIIQDCSPKLVLMDSIVHKLYLMDRYNPLSKTRGKWPDLPTKVTDRLAQLHHPKPVCFDELSSTEDEMAFLQYTSGSTGNPKGVQITFRQLHADVNIMRNWIIENHKDTGGMPSQIVGVSWLPPYHDMGLVCAILTPLVGGWRTHMMSPVSFLQNPLLWIRLIADTKATWSVAPDFAYRLVVRKFEEQPSNAQRMLEGIDLSKVQSLVNAAEPIRVDSFERLHNTFARYGLPDHCFFPGYGLAEHVAGVCGRHGVEISYANPDKGIPSCVAVANLIPLEGFSTTGCYLLDVGNDQHKLELPTSVKIVDPASCETIIQEDEIGELWLSDDAVASGYFGRAELSEQTFRAKVKGEDNQSFLRTGDLAFVQDRKLFISGRYKDLIICQGVNYYPQDIEAVVQDASPAVRPGCLAAFSRNDQTADGEIEIVFEARKGTEDLARVCADIHTAVISSIGVVPSRIVAIPERSIPKTTSGKIRRRATRSSLHERKLSVLFEYRNGATLDEQALPRRKNDPNDGKTDVLERTLQAFLGNDYDPTKTWEELGLSSMALTELKQAIAHEMKAELEPNFLIFQNTPALVRQHFAPEPKRALPPFVEKMLQLAKAGPKSISSFKPSFMFQPIIAVIVAAAVWKKSSLNLLPDQQMNSSEGLLLLAVVFLFYQQGTQHGAKEYRAADSPRGPEAYVAATGVGFVGAKVLTDEMQQMDQDDRKRLQQDDCTISFSTQISCATGIQSRHLSNPFYHQKAGSMVEGTGVQCDMTSHKLETWTRTDRLNLWWKVACKAAERSARAALDDWASKPSPAHRGNASDITHIIITTASGWKEPGIACHLIEKLGLSHDVQKQELHMNGCFCASTCLRLARDIVRAGGQNHCPREGNYEARSLQDGVGNVGRRCVLVVGVEVPSAHHDTSMTDREDVLAMSLFSDGSGAAIIAPAGEWKFRETGSHVVPNSKGLLGLEPCHPDLFRTNYKMILKPEVPQAIYEYLQKPDFGRLIIDRMAASTTETAGGSGRTHRPAMAVHPGGPRILGAVHRVLMERGWPKDSLKCCERTFNQRGNLGSTATLVVLNDILKDNEYLRDYDDLGVMAFGPGVTVEYAMLRREPSA